MRADAVSRAVLEQLRELHCLEPEQTVCCALSGGADSVCLLRCLLELRPVLGITITAVHVNHHLRGAESERDRTFCQQLCAGLGVRLAVYDVNPAARAAQEHCSEELAARECRYAAFAQVQADWIATAHTASDNLETAVHRLVRGASLHGLTAIPPKNGRFLRPLLRVTRRQVEQYLESLGQTYVTDSTNLTDAYTRNRIRHQVIPALEQLNPSVERTVSYTLRSLRRRTISCTSRHRQPMPNAIPERIPFPAWKRFTRRCSSGVLPCCWRRRGSPVKPRCWNGWRHWHGRAAGGICLVLFMLWESRAH